MLKNFWLIAFLLLNPVVSAQKSWTLDECVDFALTHNLTLKDLGFNEEAAKETYRQSVRNLLPSVNGFSGYSIRYGRSTDPNTNDIINTDFFSNDYSLESGLDLFQGFQKWNRIRASKFLYEANKQELLQQEYLLVFDVMTAYYDIMFNQGLLTNAKEQYSVSEDNYLLVEKQIELGIKAKSDLYEAKSLLLTDKLAVTQAENQLATARLQLRQIMTYTEEEEIRIVTDIEAESTEIPELEADSVYQNSEKFIPMVKAQEWRAKAAKKQLAVERGRLMPSLTFFAGYGTGYFETRQDSLGNTLPFRTQLRDNAFRYMGLNLNVPIFNQWAARSRVKQQKIELARQENNLKIRKQELRQIIEQLTQDHISLKDQLAQSEQKVEAQQLAFTIAQKKYEKGLINALDLLQAKNLYATAQNENLQVRLRWQVTQKTLAFYQGLPVFNLNGVN